MRDTVLGETPARRATMSRVTLPPDGVSSVALPAARGRFTVSPGKDPRESTDKSHGGNPRNAHFVKAARGCLVSCHRRTARSRTPAQRQATLKTQIAQVATAIDRDRCATLAGMIGCSPVLLHRA
jgi:hypothetical protein